MQVGHYLSAFPAAVDNHPVTAFSEATVPCQFIGDVRHPPDEGRFGFGKMIKRFYVFFGDDKQVGGCCRVNITEGNQLIILVKKITGYISGYYLAKNAVHSFISFRYLILLGFIYLTPLIPLSFKGEGEDFKRGTKPLLDSFMWDY